MESAFKRRLLALIVLEECYIQDKVIALPLLLRLFESSNRRESAFELVPAY